MLPVERIMSQRYTVFGESSDYINTWYSLHQIRRSHLFLPCYNQEGLYSQSQALEGSVQSSGTQT